MVTTAIFHARLRDLLETSGRTDRWLSRAIGRAPTYIATIRRQRSSPSIDVLVAIAREMQVSTGYLLGVEPEMQIDLAHPARTPIEEQAEKLMQRVMTAATQKLFNDGKPSIEEVMAWWYANNGRLEDCDLIIEEGDLMHVPKSDGSDFGTAQMGPNSLASGTLGYGPSQRLDHFLQTLPENQFGQLVSEYLEADKQPTLSQHTITLKVTEYNKAVRLYYCKIMVPVTDRAGNKYILNYSKPIMAPIRVKETEIASLPGYDADKPSLEQLT